MASNEAFPEVEVTFRTVAESLAAWSPPDKMHEYHALIAEHDPEAGRLYGEHLAALTRLCDYFRARLERSR